MHNPLISVILPIYNGANYLSDAIESILGQTFKDFELILINDGSSDNSLKIAQAYKKKDTRVVLISQENIGLVATLNKGISLAKGQFIARMDQDDISLANRFYEQVKVLNNGIDICGCHFFVIDESDRLLDSYVMPRTKKGFLAVLSQGVPFAHGSVMFKRSFLDTHNLSYSCANYRNAEDYLLWTRFFECGAKMYNVDEFLFKYRWFSESLSKLNSGANKKDAYGISKSFINSNKEQLLDVIGIEVDNLTPFEKEHFCTTLFYLFLTFKLNGQFSVFNKIPLKIKISSFLKSLHMIIKG